MVVDDLQDLSLVEALHGLGGLVVVHQDDAALAQGDDVAAADSLKWPIRYRTKGCKESMTSASN